MLCGMSTLINVGLSYYASRSGCRAKSVHLRAPLKFFLSLQSKVHHSCTGDDAAGRTYTLWPLLYSTLIYSSVPHPTLVYTRREWYSTDSICIRLIRGGLSSDAGLAPWRIHQTLLQMNPPRFSSSLCTYTRHT